MDFSCLRRSLYPKDTTSADVVIECTFRRHTSGCRVATPKAHVGEALRAQRAPPPPLTPAQRDAAGLQALVDAARPKSKGAAAPTDPLTGGCICRSIFAKQHDIVMGWAITAAASFRPSNRLAVPPPHNHMMVLPPHAGDLFAEVPLEAMTGLQRSASPRPSATTPAARAGANASNPFAEYNAALSSKSARSAVNVPPYSVRGDAAGVKSVGSGTPTAALPGAPRSGGQTNGKAAGGIAPLQISASAAGTGSTASR